MWVMKDCTSVPFAPQKWREKIICETIWGSIREKNLSGAIYAAKLSDENPRWKNIWKSNTMWLNKKNHKSLLISFWWSEKIAIVKRGLDFLEAISIVAKQSHHRGREKDPEPMKWWPTQ